MSEQAHEAPDLDVDASNVEEQAAEQVEISGAEEQDTELAKEPERTPEQRADDLQKVVAEKAFKVREVGRENSELKAQLEELRKLQEPKSPEAPELPDRWEFDSDESYSQAVNKYAEAKSKQALQAHADEMESQYKQKAESERVHRSNEELIVKARDYSGRADSLGVKAEDLAKAGRSIQAYGINDDIAEAILHDEIGPLVTQYLASNPAAIDELNNSTWANGETVYRKVREAASRLKPASSNAPPPADTLTGGATPKAGGPPGVTYE